MTTVPFGFLKRFAFFDFDGYRWRVAGGGRAVTVSAPGLGSARGFFPCEFVFVNPAPEKVPARKGRAVNKRLPKSRLSDGVGTLFDAIKSHQNDYTNVTETLLL